MKRGQVTIFIIVGIVFFSINHKEYEEIERNLTSYVYQIEEEDWALSHTIS